MALYAAIGHESFADVAIFYDPKNKIYAQHPGEFAILFKAPERICMDEFRLLTMPLKLTLPKNLLNEGDTIDKIVMSDKALGDKYPMSKFGTTSWIINTESILADKNNYYFSIVGVFRKGKE